jgi:outer membrane lipoprotein-sorting protein
MIRSAGDGYLRLLMTKLTKLAAATVLTIAAARAQNTDEILKKMRDTYAAMGSYSDSGVVVNEYGSTDRHTFTTHFHRAPRHFMFDFRKQGGDRFVVWADPAAFHTWWRATGGQYDFPNPNNAAAISGSGQNTKGSALKIPTLLYSKAALGGDFNNFADVVLDGTEEIGGRRCYRLLGRASDSYAATGREVNSRKMTVWIDAGSFLILQILEEWKAPAGSRIRVTTTYLPQANPSLDDSEFRFTPPEPK